MALEVKLFLKDHFSKTFGGVVKSLGRAVTQTLKWGTALAGVFTGLAIKKASDFQNQLSQIATLSNFTTKEIANMGREIKILGIESGRSLSELTKARYDIVSAGFVEVTQSMILMNEASKLAVAGASSVAATANILTSALNAYGYQADQTIRISDVLFTTVKLGKTTIDELASSLGQVMPFAKAAGVEIEGVGAAMATLTLSGLDTAMAATALRSAFRNLSAPTKEAKNEMEAAGISVKYFENGTMDLYETFKQFDGMSLDQITKFIPDVRASTAILSLSSNVEVLRKSFEEMENASGASATAYEKRLKTFRVQWDRLLNNMNVALIDIGEKMLEKITPIVTDINDKLSKIGEIGWDNVGSAIIQNLRVIGQMIIETMKIIGSTAGQTLKMAFKKAARNLFNLEDPVEKAKKQIDELRTELEKKQEYRASLVLDTDWDRTKLPSRQQIEVSMDIKKADKEILALGAQIAALEIQLEEFGDNDFSKNLAKAFEEIRITGKTAFQEILTQAQKLKEESEIASNESTEISIENLTTLAEWRDEYTQEMTDKIKAIENKEKEAAENTVNYWKTALITMSEEQQEWFNQASQILGSAGQLWSSFSQMRKAQIAAEYDDRNEILTDWYERQKTAIEKTVDDETQKTERLKSLDEDYYHKTQNLKQQQLEEEKKFAEKMKVIRISQAIGEAAMAVLSALNTKPFVPLGLAMATIATGIGATQIATIQAQPYAEGTMNVNAPLSDMIPAVLSPGESVNTRETTSSYSAEIAKLNQMAQSGSVHSMTSGSGIPASGGDTYNVTIHAIDSKSFEEFMRENPRAFAEAFKSAIKSRDVGYLPSTGILSHTLIPKI